jgi:hypothetical protein
MSQHLHFNESQGVICLIQLKHTFNIEFIQEPFDSYFFKPMEEDGIIQKREQQVCEMVLH